MNHDEKTTELELPKAPISNVVSMPAAHTARAVAAVEERRAGWWKDLDLGAPWVLRLVAVISILILSMLVL